MKPNIRFVTIAALIIIVGTGLYLNHARVNQRLGAPGVKLVNVPTLGEDGRLVSTQSVYLPPIVLGSASSNLPVTKMELYWLPPDTTYGRRLYLWTNQPLALVSVVLMGGDRTSIHKPEFCLNGQGWHYKASDTEVIHVPMSQPFAYDLPVMKVTATQQRQTPQGEITLRGLYLYWFVNDREISALHTSRMRSQTLHMLRTGELQRWAYISVFSQCLPGQEEATLAWLTQVIQAAVPHFQVPPVSAESVPRPLASARHDELDEPRSRLGR